MTHWLRRLRLTVSDSSSTCASIEAPTADSNARSDASASRRTRSVPRTAHGESAPLTRRASRADGERAYDASFWKSFVSNFFGSAAVAVLYRYADFVTLLGGTELHLGWIVGIGMLGSMTMRLVVGRQIDGRGPRRVWLASLALLAAVCFAHVLVARYPGASIHSPLVVAACAGLRIAMWCAIAGVYASSMTFIVGRVPVIRMAELLGMLGTSGFAGMTAGVWVSDQLFSGSSLSAAAAVERMFLVAGLFVLAAFTAAWWATAGYQHRAPRHRLPMWSLIRRYHPGRVLLMSVAMGFGLGLPATFLRTFAAELDIPRIGVFFTTYSITAVITRVLARRLPERYGLRPVVLAGLALVIASQGLFLLVRHEWQFVLPSLTYGIGHAILFPAGFAEGCRPAPPRYRGLSTSLMLASYDLGLLIGAPIAGLLVHFGQAVGWPGYPTLFSGVAILLTFATAIYAGAPQEVAPRRRAKRPVAQVAASVPAPLAVSPASVIAFPQEETASGNKTVARTGVRTGRDEVCL